MKSQTMSRYPPKSDCSFLLRAITPIEYQWFLSSHLPSIPSKNRLIVQNIRELLKFPKNVNKQHTKPEKKANKVKWFGVIKLGTILSTMTRIFSLSSLRYRSIISFYSFGVFLLICLKLYSKKKKRWQTRVRYWK